VKLTLSDQWKQFVRLMQGCLFPKLEEALGPLTDMLRQLIAVLELVQIEAMVGPWHGGAGRPAPHERAIARAFVAKAVYNLSHTRQLLDRLHNDPSLRRICGWQSRREIPHESQFLRAFVSFAASEVPERLHAALIEATQKDRLIGHISRDSTAARPGLSTTGTLGVLLDAGEAGLVAPPQAYRRLLEEPTFRTSPALEAHFLRRFLQ
jgi:hypothetical protein